MKKIHTKYLLSARYDVGTMHRKKKKADSSPQRPHNVLLWQ